MVSERQKGLDVTERVVTQKMKRLGVTTSARAEHEERCVRSTSRLLGIALAMRRVQCACGAHAIACLMLPALVVGKVIDGTAVLSSQNTEQYMTKFSFSPYARSHIEGSFEVENGIYFDHHPHELVLALYDEPQWQKFQQSMKKGSLCVDRLRLASWKTDKIQPGFRAGERSGPRNFNFDSYITAPSGRAHYWYAVLMDCYLEEYDAHPPPMKYHITLWNGKSHLPEDESGMQTINLLTMLAMVAYGSWFGYSAFSKMQRVGQVHLITLVFGVAYGLQLISVFCELLHLRRFASDGKGLRWRHTIFALDFLSGLTQTISELVLSVLLTSLAFGWTLGIESQEPIDGLLGKVLAGLHRPGLLLRGLWSPSALLLLGIGGAQLILHTLGHRYDDDFNNFHDFEHWCGTNPDATNHLWPVPNCRRDEVFVLLAPSGCCGIPHADIALIRIPDVSCLANPFCVAGQDLRSLPFASASVVSSSGHCGVHWQWNAKQRF